MEKFEDKRARMDYEMVLRNIAKLIEGNDPGRGALNGYADADWWDSFATSSGDNVYEILGDVIKGIMMGLDTIRQKIEFMEARIEELESSIID